MALCYANKGYLYQQCPWIIPYGFLTPLEIELWKKFFAELKDFPQLLTGRDKIAVAMLCPDTEDA